LKGEQNKFPTHQMNLNSTSIPLHKKSCCKFPIYFLLGKNFEKRKEIST
jgi:hypothetical protein